MRVMSL